MTPSTAVSRRPRKRRAAEAVAAPAPPIQQDWTNLDPNDLSSPALYINRELSWLAFNRRVRMKDGLTFSHPGPGNPGIVGYAGPIDPQVGTVGAPSRSGCDTVRRNCR